MNNEGNGKSDLVDRYVLQLVYLDFSRYIETKDYDWRKAQARIDYLDWGRVAVIRHFTTIVWKEAKKVGMGLSYDYKDGKYAMYAVARYAPLFNVGGIEMRRKMVKKLKQGAFLI